MYVVIGFHKIKPEHVDDYLKRIPDGGANPLRIAFVTPELQPLVRRTNLAEVAGWAKPWVKARQKPARPSPTRAALMRSVAMPRGYSVGTKLLK